MDGHEISKKDAIDNLRSLALDLVYQSMSFEIECCSHNFNPADANNSLAQIEDVVKKLRENINILCEDD